MDLDTAPKLYTIIHLVLRLLGSIERSELSKHLRVDNTSYLPRIKNDIHEKFFCDFLSFYFDYLHSFLGASEKLGSVYAEVVNIDKYLEDNLLKQEDCSLVAEACGILFKLVKVRIEFSVLVIFGSFLGFLMSLIACDRLLGLFVSV